MSRFPIEAVEDLRYARELLENPGLAAKLTNVLGAPIERGLERLPEKWSEKVQGVTRSALMKGLEFSIRTLDREPKPASEFLHKLIATGAGACGGALGFASLPLELPVSTAIMLRSIADIARSEGEDISTVETRLACLEVFAFGGRAPGGDASDTGYFAVRSGLAKALSDAAKHIAREGLSKEGAPVVVRFVAAVAERFGIVVSEKLAATLVPIIGAASCAAINLLFMDHFQNIARGHFIIRRLERDYGPEAVRQTWDELT